MIEVKDVLEDCFTGLCNVEQKGNLYVLYFTQRNFRDKAYYMLMGKFGSTMVDKSKTKKNLMVEINRGALRLLLGDIILGDFNEPD